MTRIVSQIRIGHRIKTDAATYTVLGSMKMRGGYCYIARDEATGRKISIRRDDLLQAQRDGDATITA